MSKQLLINSNDLPKKVNQLLESVSKNKKTYNEFIKNPFQVLANAMPNEMGKMSEIDISNSNKLLLALLASARFRNWLIKYQKILEIEMSKPENLNKSIDEVFPNGKVWEVVAASMVRYCPKNKELRLDLRFGPSGLSIWPCLDIDLMYDSKFRFFGPIIDLGKRVLNIRAIAGRLTQPVELKNATIGRKVKLGAATKLENVAIRRNVRFENATIIKNLKSENATIKK